MTKLSWLVVVNSWVGWENNYGKNKSKKDGGLFYIDKIKFLKWLIGLSGCPYDNGYRY